MRRREFMGAVGLSAAAMALGRRASAAPFSARRPRALLQIVLTGGIDALLTTDPKVSSQVDRRIVIPYAEDAIRTVGKVRIAPLMSALERHVPRMAIVNGVVGGTVSHYTGALQIVQVRRVFPPGSAGLVGTVGAVHRGDAPCEQILMGPEWVFPQPSGRALRNVDGSLLERMSAVARDEGVRRAVQTELRAQLASAPAGGDRRLALEVTEGMIEGLSRHELPPAIALQLPVPEVNGSFAQDGDKAWSRCLRDILFLFKHQLTPTILLMAPVSLWDSHQDNLLKQQWCMDRFAPHLGYLLDAFDRVRTADGRSLSEQVGVLISSELGRYPISNEMNGKDHFPEHPAILIGPGIRPGQYGDTDERMISQPISLRTGRPSSSRRDVVPTLDDLGATVLHWFGIEDTTSFGYVGRRLDFLLG